MNVGEKMEPKIIKCHTCGVDIIDGKDKKYKLANDEYCCATCDKIMRTPIHANSNKGHVGRNDPCPCGSGKKFKKCCLVSSL